jgi:hypothetical protein
MGITLSLSTDFVCGFSNRIYSSISPMYDCWTKAMPKINVLGLGEHELLCSCSSLMFENDESIWRLYPAAAPSWSLFFEWMI